MAEAAEKNRQSICISQNSLGGNDSYQNLIIVSAVVHILIHSSNERTIRKYLKVLNLDKKQLAKLNKLRVMAEMQELVF